MQKKKVFIGMSGGVDSSIAAALLKDQGYEVIGVTMQIWPANQAHEDVEGSCCSLTAVEDARRVAQMLEIPYYVMNFRDVFAEKVISNFCSEYAIGRTPNPCIACNKHIKFDAFLQKAKALGADYIATGHYARTFYDSTLNRYLLSKSADDNKDQTYALYGLTQEQISKTLFPLGDYTKPQIRDMASELDLRVANKPDSQEICFVPDDNYKNFLKEKNIKLKPGPFLDSKGSVVGTHEGIANYTIGQRKGLGLALGKPVYVTKIDPEKNAVIVGNDNEVFGKRLSSINNNYILIDQLENSMKVKAKIRYSAPAASAIIYPSDGEKVLVEFVEPQRAITPGQAIVFYKDDLVVGGGTIEKQLD